MEVFDIFLAEAILNGLLLGGLLALLSLGLNLVFGVIDVVWICYAELIMIGMYTALPARGLRLAAVASLPGVHRGGLGPWCGVAPLRDPPGACRRTGQPAAGHRRRAVFPAG